MTTPAKLSTRTYGIPGETRFTAEHVQRVLANLTADRGGFPTDSIVSMGRDDRGDWLQIDHPDAWRVASFDASPSVAPNPTPPLSGPLAANLGDAWDEGYDAAMDLMELGVLRMATGQGHGVRGRTPNPYRIDAQKGDGR